MFVAIVVVACVVVACVVLSRVRGGGLEGKGLGEADEARLGLDLGPTGVAADDRAVRGDDRLGEGVLPGLDVGLEGLARREGDLVDGLDGAGVELGLGRRVGGRGGFEDGPAARPAVARGPQGVRRVEDDAVPGEPDGRFETGALDSFASESMLN